MSSATDIDSIWIFSPLDKLMVKHKGEKEKFEKLFGRKKDLLELVKNFKVDADKYKKIMLKAYKNGDDFIKECAAQDCSKLKNGKDPAMINEWFKQMIEDTGSFYEEQEKIYKKYTQKEEIKLAPVTDLKQSLNKSVLRKTVKVDQPSSEIDYKQIVSLKAADTMLMNFEQNVAIYEHVLNKKLSILQSIDSKGITAEGYKTALKAMIPKIKNQDIAFQTNLEFQGLEDFHGGNTEAWFNQTVNEAKQSVNNQKRHLLKLKPGAQMNQSTLKAPVPKPPKGADMKQTSHELKPNIPSGKNKTSEIRKSSQIKSVKRSEIRVSKNQVLKISQIYSFKALEELLDGNSDNSEMVKQIKERKKKLFEEHKNGSLSAKKYKEQLENYLKVCSNPDIKSSIEMQLDLLKDLFDGDVQAWYSDVIEAAEVDDLVDAPLQDVNLAQINKKNEQKMKKSIKQPMLSSQKLDVNKINMKQFVNLRAIDEFLSQNKQNRQLYCMLFEKKLKIFDEMKNEKITADIYLKLQNQVVQSTQNERLKDIIQMDVMDLNTLHDDNLQEWFQSLINESGTDFEEQQMTYQQLKKQNKNTSKDKKQDIKQSKQPKKVPERSGNEKKIQNFLREMARYESLYYYHKKNKIPYDSNQYLRDYEKKVKKNIQTYLKEIQSKKFSEIHDLTDQLFPPITQQIFYGGQFATLKKQGIPKLIAFYQAEQASLKDYLSKTKRSINPKNIKKATQQMSQCAQTINYLNKWPYQKYEPFPVVTNEKIQKYNMDLNELQPEQVQINLLDIEGFKQKIVVKVYIGPSNHPQYQNVIEKAIKQPIIVVGKLNEQQMIQVLRGKKKHIRIAISEKKFFGGQTALGERQIQTIFVRNNINQGSIQIGELTIPYIVKVQKAFQPIITQIVHNTLSKIPPYEHSRFVEEQLIKKYMIYSNPTPSEISH